MLCWCCMTACSMAIEYLHAINKEDLSSAYISVIVILHFYDYTMYFLATKVYRSVYFIVHIQGGLSVARLPCRGVSKPD